MKALARDCWNEEDVEVEITRFHHLTAGYGHKKVLFEVEYNGHKKTFTSISTDMEFFDSLEDDNYSEWEQLYFDNFFDDISERVDEWVSDIAESVDDLGNRIDELKAFEVKMSVTGQSKDQTKTVFVRAESEAQLLACDSVLKVWPRQDMLASECTHEIAYGAITFIDTLE